MIDKVEDELQILTKREFDKRYQNMKEWPLDTLYVFYKDLMEEVIKELKERR